MRRLRYARYTKTTDSYNSSRNPWFAVNQTVTFVGKVNTTVGKVHKSNEIQQQNFQQTMSQDFRRSQEE